MKDYEDLRKKVRISVLVLRIKASPHKPPQILWADFLNAVYFRRGPTCTFGLTNDLIDGGQPRAKPQLRKAKLYHVLKPGCSPGLTTVYYVVG